jgi:hypothetical protein
MDPINYINYAVQMSQIINSTLQFITFKSIYSYVLADIFLITLIIALESPRVENIVILLLEIAIIQWFFVFALLGLLNIGYINFPPIEIIQIFMAPAVILLILALFLSKVT